MTRPPDARDRVERVIDGHRVVFDRATSVRMAGIRQHGTEPELVVRRCLAALGLRYRLSNRDLPGSPDMANRTKRWAVFVHGCYWHRHPGCERTTKPKRNADFWLAKFAANVAGTRVQHTLEASGYRVLTVWECATVDEAHVKTGIARFAARVEGYAAASTRRRPAKSARRERNASGSQSKSSRKSSKSGPPPRTRSRSGSTIA